MSFTQRHLLGIEHLHPAEITDLLDLAEHYVALNRQQRSECRRRAARTSDASAFGCADHPPRQGPPAQAKYRDLRRYRPQPRGPFEHPFAGQDGKPRTSDRSANAYALANTTIATGWMRKS